jgi:MFS family permease
VSPDGRLLLVSRGVRGVADGAVAVALSAYLAHLGFSGGRIGLVVTSMLIGSALLTLLVGTRGHGLGRRTLLQLGAVTMLVTGLVYAWSTIYLVLVVVGFVGTLNPTGGDVSVFAPIEQSLLPGTVDDRQRTATFARYAFVGSICVAVGSLAAGLPGWIARHADADPDAALRWVFLAYAAAGVVVLAVSRSLSPAIEPPPHAAPSPLGASRPIVLRLAALFSLDSFAGGFTVQSLIALWLFRRFDLSVAAAGALLFWTGVCAALSTFASARLARRIGLVRTMVFSHMPAQVFLILAALMPSVWPAVACLVLRSLLSTMDVPARSSYVMAVVSPAERAAAASVTNVPRALAAALPPVAAGWMLDRTSFGWPLVIAGSLKLVYDVLLLAMFRHVRPPEELPAG